jgi:hypothetical protein
LLVVEPSRKPSDGVVRFASGILDRWMIQRNE